MTQAESTIAIIIFSILAVCVALLPIILKKGQEFNEKLKDLHDD